MSKNSLFPFFAFLFLFAVWEISCRLSPDIFLILPSPSNILIQIWKGSDRFLFHTLVTSKTMLGGITFAFLIAFPLAWIMSLYSSARLILQPIFVVIQCIPMFALAPIMVIWFGWTYTAIVVPTTLMIFFPLTMNIYQGLRSTPRHLVDYFHCNQATAWQLFYKLQLPWAAPHIFAGFRIAAGIAGIGAIAGEWAGAQSGLGLLMLESRRAADLEVTFGALFCLTAISLALYGIILTFEKMAMRRMYSRSLHVFAATSILLFGVIFTGCQSDLPNNRETRLALDWLPNPNHVPLYAGLQKGIFAKHGISLVIHKTRDPGDSLPYLTSRQVELAISYMPHTLRAISRGAHVQPVAILIPEPLNAIIYRQGEGITRPADLNEKVMGYCIDGSAPTFLDFLLATNGIVVKEKKNVSFDLISTLGMQRVDAIYGAFWNIEGEQLRSLGIETGYFELAQFGVPSYYELVAFAKEGSLQTDPAFIKSIQHAFQESIDFCQAHPEEAFALYLKANPDKSEKTQQWERKAWHTTYPLLARTQEIDAAKWDKFSDWFALYQMPLIQQ